MQENNSLNGQEHQYETGNVYTYEFFKKICGGQVFTLTEKECTEGLERIINRTSKGHINGSPIFMGIIWVPCVAWFLYIWWVEEKKKDK